MWLPHIRSLSVILRKRHELYGEHEPHKFVIFAVLVVDTFATLSSCSNGEFVGMLVEQGLLPTGKDAMPPLRNSPGLHLYADEEDCFQSLLRFNVRILVLACRLSQLAAEIRDGVGSQPHAADDWHPITNRNLPPSDQQRRVTVLRDELVTVWQTEMPARCRERASPGVPALPGRMVAFFEHVGIRLLSSIETSTCSCPLTLSTGGRALPSEHHLLKIEHVAWSACRRDRGPGSRDQPLCVGHSEDDPEESPGG